MRGARGLRDAVNRAVQSECHMWGRRLSGMHGAESVWGEVVRRGSEVGEEEVERLLQGGAEQAIRIPSPPPTSTSHVSPRHRHRISFRSLPSACWSPQPTSPLPPPPPWPTLPSLRIHPPHPCRHHHAPPHRRSVPANRHRHRQAPLQASLGAVPLTSNRSTFPLATAPILQTNQPPSHRHR